MVSVTVIDGDLQVTTEVGILGVLLFFVPLFLWQDQSPSGDKRTWPAISHATGLRMHSAPFLQVMRQLMDRLFGSQE